MITSAKYQHHEGVRANIEAVRDGIKIIIPMDTDNSDYAELIKQVDLGLVVIEEAEDAS